MAIDVSEMRWSKPLHDITLPNPYSGETAPKNEYRPIHPGIATISGGWNGYIYWLVYTPYPDSDSSYENPCIAASNDGVTWTEPAGLINPIVDSPAGVAYNADTDLFYDDIGDQLCVVYRERSGSDNQLRLLTSSNGISWSLPTTIKTGLIASNQDYASPSLTYNGSNYRIYYINADSAAAEKPVEYIESSSIASGWGAETPVSSFPVTDVTWWNLYLKWDGEKYIGFAQDTSTPGSAGDLYICESADGATFTSSLFYSSLYLYRCCFSLIPGSNGEYLTFIAGSGLGQYIRAGTVKFDATLANEIRTDVNDLVGAALIDSLHGDNLIRANQAGVGSSTDGSTPDLETGSWEIASNTLQLSVSGNSRVAYDIGTDSVLIRCGWGALALQDQWVIARMLDASNYIRVGHSNTGNITVQEIVSGAVTNTYGFPFLADIADNEEIELRVNSTGFVLEQLTTGGISFVDNTTFAGESIFGQQFDSTGKTVTYFNMLPYLEEYDRFKIDLEQLNAVAQANGVGTATTTGIISSIIS